MLSASKQSMRDEEKMKKQKINCKRTNMESDVKKFALTNNNSKINYHDQKETFVKTTKPLVINL